MTDICDEIRAAMNAACEADPESQSCILLTELYLSTCTEQTATVESLATAKTQLAAYYDGQRDHILGLIDKKAAELE